MKLSALIAHLDPVSVHGPTDVDVRALTRDSREAGPDTVFVALRGERVDGHRFVANLSAAAVVVEREVVALPGVTVVRVRDTHRALAELAAAWHERPSDHLALIGITGTNGKTTITTLVDIALRDAGVASGRIGTTGTVVNGRAVPSALTTPMADDLQALLADMVTEGVEAVAMEVSSIGLHQHRVHACTFFMAVFTNFSRDHLDYHGSEEAYLQAKALLFREPPLRVAGGPPRVLYCADDPAWHRLDLPADRWGYGFSADADLRIIEISADSDGMALAVATPMGLTDITSPLVGRYNALNLTAALGALLLLGLGLEEASTSLSVIGGVRGRLEPVPNDRGFTVIVDYAHTPDALANALSALRDVTRGRLWVVFGCGGDRDAGKRPLMGRVAEQLADVVIVTSDNPRSEAPSRIIAQIVEGMDEPPVRAEVRREVAITAAIVGARPGDVVLIAGKGHETYQEIAGELVPFDDRDVAARALRELP